MSEYVIESAMDLDASGAMDLAASSLPSDMLRKPTAISAGLLLLCELERAVVACVLEDDAVVLRQFLFNDLGKPRKVD